VVASGGTLVEVIGARVVALPPVSTELARALVAGLGGLTKVLGGVRGGPAADVDALVAAVVAIGQLAVELGDSLEALDVNPLICSPGGAVAVDALVVPRPG
jgi:hypothetical protein